MPKPKKTLEIYNCSTLEAAFNKAREQARNLAYGIGDDSEWSEVYSVKLKFVHAKIDLTIRYDNDRDDIQPTFVFEVEANG